VVGKALVVLGLLVAGLGVAMMLGVPLFRLPGDFYVKRDNFTFYFPLTSSIILSILLTLLFTLFRR
jgi:predicted MFS family arabinose efflux permease